MWTLLRIDGMAPSWWHVPRRDFGLLPGERETFDFVIHPPPGTPAGDYPFRFIVLDFSLQEADHGLAISVGGLVRVRVPAPGNAP